MTTEPLSSAAGDQELQMRMLIDSAPVAMLVVDPHGQIIIANHSASDVFGYPLNRLIGMNVDALVPTAYRASHRPKVKSFFQALVPRVMGVGREVLAVNSRGVEFPVEIGLSPVKTPNGPLVVAVIIDITERKRRDKESTLARLVQEAMLPEIPESLDGLEMAARAEPADATGGDFYDLLHLAGGKTGLIIGDASGHGFAAALVTTTARSYLRALSQIESDLSSILSKTNQLLINDVLDGRFVTLLYVAIDLNRMKIEYAGAGHVGYLVDRNGDLRSLLDNNGPPLGWFSDTDYPINSISIEHGDLLVLLTDGIEEAMSPAGGQFGRQRVLDVLKRNINLPARQIVEKLHEAVHAFHAGDEPHDDATAVVVRIT